MGYSLNEQAVDLLGRRAAEEAARAEDEARAMSVFKVISSLPVSEGGDDVGLVIFRERFEGFLDAVFDSGITEKQGWLTLPQVSDLLEYGCFGGTDLTPDTRAIVFAYHGFASGNVKGVFSRVGFLRDGQGDVARSALRGMPGADYFSGWKMPKDVGEVLRPVLVAVAHGELKRGNGDDVFTHFEDSNFSEFDGGITRGGRSEWVAADKLVGVARLGALGESWPEAVRPFFSELHYRGDAGMGEDQPICILKNPPLFR